ncbi:MAG: VWA domain-containing protein [Candidatus Omnitrophica bacterium]|nr:VWA domain-containing protein [Candidatus Omnitrophota bacterium]
MEIKRLASDIFNRLGNGIKENTVIFAAVVSIILHMVFFVYSSIVVLPGIRSEIERSKAIFNIKTVEKKPVVKRKKPPQSTKTTYLQKIKFESPALPTGASLSAADEKIEKDGFSKEAQKISKPVSIEQLKDLGDLEKEKRREHLAKKGQRKTKKDIVEVDRGILDTAAGPEDLLEADFSEEFFEEMPGFTPKSVGGIMQDLKRGILSRFGISETSPIRRKGAFSGLEEYLVYNLAAYSDPENGKKYYKITIHAGKDVGRLKRMPKEIVFLIDCSLSIQKERLEEFKEGLLYALKNLNPDDVFNIMAFKETVSWFRGDPVKPDPEIIKEAMAFVEALSAGEGTDAYKALLEAIQKEASITPSYIVIFSDGRPTYGITDSRKIINKISMTNKGERPIFVLSGGLRVNRYFLDFISYKNRGWAEYAQRSHQVAGHISKMYEKIKDPVFLNLRYRVNGLNVDEIFPKTLPDFYRHAEFNIYGAYEDEDEFSLQLLGDIENEVNEFIVVDSLKGAALGGENIAREWAFNKIYHLIGILEHDSNNKEIIEEINTLCDKFGIKTPYSDEIKK